MRLLELLDWGKLTEGVLRRKRFLGFSDITALHLAFQTVAPGVKHFIKTMSFAFKMINFALQMMDFAFEMTDFGGLVTLHGPMPASCFGTITQGDADRLRAVRHFIHKKSFFDRKTSLFSRKSTPSNQRHTHQLMSTDVSDTLLVLTGAVHRCRG